MNGSTSYSPWNLGSRILKTLSRTYSTSLSGVDAPEVMPMVTGPSGSQQLVSRISPWAILCRILFSSESMQAAELTQKLGMPAISGISCRTTKGPALPGCRRLYYTSGLLLTLKGGAARGLRTCCTLGSTAPFAEAALQNPGQLTEVRPEEYRKTWQLNQALQSTVHSSGHMTQKQQVLACSAKFSCAVLSSWLLLWASQGVLLEAEFKWAVQP